MSAEVAEFIILPQTYKHKNELITTHGEIEE